FIDSVREVISKNQINIVIGWIIYLAPLYKVINNKDIIYIANQGQMAPRSILLSFLKKVALKNISLIDALRTSLYISLYSRYLTKIVSISESVKESCIRAYNLNALKCSVINRGIDINIYSYRRVQSESSKNGKATILYTGNIHFEKGINDLVNSLKYVKTAIKLVLCGKGEESYINDLKLRVNSFNLSHELIAPGVINQNELVQYYHNCDIFVFCSHSEGLGKSLLEAMSCGCSVICSDIDTFKEIIEPGYNGAIVKLRSPESIADTINKYLAYPELRKKYSINARKTIEEKFNKEFEINKWKTLIEEEIKINLNERVDGNGSN
ncbi:MAG: glycosyltransferase family 4 protein, partial [Eubacteriales bacterium]